VQRRTDDGIAWRRSRGAIVAAGSPDPLYPYRKAACAHHGVADAYPAINANWKPLQVVHDRCWDHFVEGFPAFGGMELPETAGVIGGHLCAWEQRDEQDLPSLRRLLTRLLAQP